MKYLAILALTLLTFSAKSQVYINVEIVNGMTSFEGEAKAPGKQVGDLHALTIEWLQETFPSEDVLTQNTKTKITAKYPATYTVNGNTATFHHDMHISLDQGMAYFSITDQDMKLVHANGDWKKHLAELRVKFEEGCNELLWSYSKYIKEQQVKE